MSGHDDSIEGKGFLSRWSQRKQEAKLPDAGGAAPPADREHDAPSSAVSSGRTESETEDAFDLSTLPKLEEITGSTDITAFLRKGVPEHLRNAALRQSWALDPAVRNFVNPALDYAYDWNTPGGVPGSSELSASVDIAKMVGQIMGGGSTGDAVAPDAQPANALPQNDAGFLDADAVSPAALQHPRREFKGSPVRLPEPPTIPLTDEGISVPSDAIRNDFRSEETVSDLRAAQHSVRRHGSAKPRV